VLARSPSSELRLAGGKPLRGALSRRGRTPGIALRLEALSSWPVERSRPDTIYPFDAASASRNRWAEGHAGLVGQKRGLASTPASNLNQRVPLAKPHEPELGRTSGTIPPALVTPW
jgi:hypothetical protein